MAKGQQTKEKILYCARELFYENGFRTTTARMISERSNTNLGLLTYYFKSKNEIGRLIYANIRTGFDQLICQYRPDLEAENLFLFSSATELFLCITNEHYGRFYREFLANPANGQSIQQHISDILCQYSFAYSGNPAYTTLATLSISAIKPAIVEYALNHPAEIPADAYLRYYLEQQLHFLGRSRDDAGEFIRLIHCYHISVAERFTPVMVPLV